MRTGANHTWIFCGSVKSVISTRTKKSDKVNDFSADFRKSFKSAEYYELKSEAESAPLWIWYSVKSSKKRGKIILGGGKTYSPDFRKIG